MHQNGTPTRPLAETGDTPGETALPLRENVERGIYRRVTKDGRDRFEIMFRDRDGRHRRETLPTLRQARLRRGDLIAKAKRGEVTTPARVRLDEFANEWLEREAGRLRPGTHALYASYLRIHVLPRFGRRRIAEITADDVSAWAAWLGREGRERRTENGEIERVGQSAYTTRSLLSLLSRIFNAAKRRGLVVANPVGLLEPRERPKVERREIPELDNDALDRIVSSAPERYRTLIALSIRTGLRQSEALALRWQDIGNRDGVIRVRGQLDRSGELVPMTKTDSSRRDVPLEPKLARLLAEHRLASRHSADEDYVFVSGSGTPLQHRELSRRALDPALEGAGLPPLRWHDLRHLAASAMIASGMELRDVSYVLGHATTATTERTYKHQFDRQTQHGRIRDGLAAAFPEARS